MRYLIDGKRLGLGLGALLTWLLLILPGLKGASANESSEPPIIPPITLGLTGGIEVQGVTEGDESLTRMAVRDRRRKLCLGYATSEPSHVVTLTEDRRVLRMAVNSNGEDTTLFIQGPDGIYCNDNASRANRDAAVTARGWPAGTYRIWVGAFNRGARLNYSLRIAEPGAADTQSQ